MRIVVKLVRRKLPKKIPRDVLRAVLEAVIAEYLRLQRKRIGAGVDQDGNPWPAYSAAYEDKKRRAGRRPYSRGDWLRLSGEMLRSQQVTYNDLGEGGVEAVVEFVGTRPAYTFKAKARRGKRRRGSGPARLVVSATSRMISNAEVAARVEEKRPFIGASDDELRRLRKVFADLISVWLEKQAEKDAPSES